MSRAAAWQMSAGGNIDEIMYPLRDLLSEPVTALGSQDVRRDVDAVFYCTATMMRRYLDSTERPGPDDIDHLVRFCLRALST
ncbi:MAG: TetR/AcrR family transcriptional regulator, partial [Mycobacterium sp.]